MRRYPGVGLDYPLLPNWRFVVENKFGFVPDPYCTACGGDGIFAEASEDCPDGEPCVFCMERGDAKYMMENDK